METKERREGVPPTLYNERMKIVVQSLILVACLMALMVLSNFLRRVLSRAVRREWLFYFFLAPGTIIHELCHALACLITLTPIYQVHLFRLRREPDGAVQLGEVVHGEAGPIRNFFIAMAPLVGASVLIYGLSLWLLPRNESWEVLLRSGWTFLFLALVFFVALGLSPSRQDLKALPGFIVVAAVLGSAGYLVVRLIASRYNLAGVEQTVASALRTANMGLLFVLAVVTVMVVVLAGGLYLSRRWL